MEKETVQILEGWMNGSGPEPRILGEINKPYSENDPIVIAVLQLHAQVELAEATIRVADYLETLVERAQAPKKVLDNSGDEGSLGREQDPIDQELPPALAKACGDPFDYMLGLRTGTVIHFSEATLSANHEWVHLSTGNWHIDTFVSGHEAPFERGIDVRVADIVWVADAPFGS